MISGGLSLEDFLVKHGFEIGCCDCGRRLEIKDYGYFKDRTTGHLFAHVGYVDCCKRKNSFTAIPVNAVAKNWWKDVLS